MAGAEGHTAIGVRVARQVLKGGAVTRQESIGTGHNGQQRRCGGTQGYVHARFVSVCVLGPWSCRRPEPEPIRGIKKVLTKNFILLHLSD